MNSLSSTLCFMNSLSSTVWFMNSRSSTVWFMNCLSSSMWFMNSLSSTCGLWTVWLQRCGLWTVFSPYNEWTVNMALIGASFSEESLWWWQRCAVYSAPRPYGLTCEPTRRGSQKTLMQASTQSTYCSTHCAFPQNGTVLEIKKTSEKRKRKRFHLENKWNMIVLQIKTKQTKNEPRNRERKKSSEKGEKRNIWNSGKYFT